MIKRLWQWLMWKRYWLRVRRGKAAMCVYKGRFYMMSKRYKFPEQRFYFANGVDPLNFDPSREHHDK